MELDLLNSTSQLGAEKNIFSITEISLLLKKCVENNFNNLRLRGEISGLKKHTSGHSYFTLKDQDSVMDAVCWRGTRLALQLEDGLEIIATGRLTTYPGRSKYQLILESAEAAGQGALLKLLHERKIRLEAEGLFRGKRPLPAFPKKIGIITSATGAVIKDILHRIADRYPCSVLLWPVAVQGLGAAEQIAKAIEGFGDIPSKDQPDILIVARGGGSLEDLWAFNEEIVVRATANSKIPIISAVGHETDTTLIDFAADLRAPTPTAAAEIATPVLRNILDGLAFAKTRLAALLKNKLQNHSIHLTGLRRGLPTPQRLIETAWLRFDDWCERFAMTQSAFIDNKFRSLQHLSAQIKHPHFSIAFAEQKLNQNSQQLYILQKRFLEKLSERLKLVSVYLEQNSYQKILEKGFCWVENESKLIWSIEDFNNSTSSIFNLNFKDGKVKIETKVLSN